MEKKQRPDVYYSEYLQLDKILNAQAPESAKENIKADDEMMFIIIHQTYELWFKQVIHELGIVRETFKKDIIPNNSPDIYNCVNRIKRICAILEVAVQQMTIMETMTPLDFLEFRDLLRPASGFQSIQFKIIEGLLGLKFDQRHMQGYYLTQLHPEDKKRVEDAEKEISLLVLIDKWLGRMPFLKNEELYSVSDAGFWQQYREVYKNSLNENELGNMELFDMLFINKENYPEDRKLTVEANKSALFIMLYRDYPMLQLPFELLSNLLDIDEKLSMWRHRHIHMVQRTIGKRVGTGGSTGAAYLRGAADSHIIFKEISELTSFLVPRNLLPTLPEQLTQSLGYK